MTPIRRLILTSLLLVPAAARGEETPPPKTAARPQEATEQAPPLPEKLDDLIRQALNTNPAIVQTALQVKVAEAELHRQTIEITRKVTDLYHTRRLLEDNADNYQEQAQLLAEEAKQSWTSMSAASQLRQKQAMLRHTMLQDTQRRAQIEAELRATLGLSSAIGSQITGTFRPNTFVPTTPQPPQAALPPGETPASYPRAPAPPEPHMPAAIAKALDAKVSIDGDNLAIDDLVGLLQKATGGELLFVVDREAREEKVSVSLHLPREVTVREALEIFGDIAELSFIIRDYGVLVTERTDSVRVPGFIIIPDYRKTTVPTR